MYLVFFSLKKLTLWPNEQAYAQLHTHWADSIKPLPDLLIFLWDLLQCSDMLPLDSCHLPEKLKKREKLYFSHRYADKQVVIFNNISYHYTHTSGQPSPISLTQSPSKCSYSSFVIPIRFRILTFGEVSRAHFGRICVKLMPVAAAWRSTDILLFITSWCGLLEDPTKDTIFCARPIFISANSA